MFISLRFRWAFLQTLRALQIPQILQYLHLFRILQCDRCYCYHLNLLKLLQSLQCLHPYVLKRRRRWYSWWAVFNEAIKARCHHLKWRTLLPRCCRGSKWRLEWWKTTFSASGLRGPATLGGASSRRPKPLKPRL